MYYTYENRWIGRDVTYALPTRSLDLNPLDFYLWGHLKTLYTNPVENEEDLRNRIIEGCNA